MTTTQHVVQTDHHVKEAILAELDWIPSINADSIGVAINDGAVTLSGQVETYPEKHLAVRAAFRVRGVAAVADEIEVRHTPILRSDTDIAREVGEILARASMTPGGSVRAEVHDRVVTLTGDVVWHYQREAIRHLVAMSPGVHGVTSAITLRPTVPVSPVVAHEKIADALRRNAMIEAENITVVVAGNEITLTGTVSTWAERSQASHAAWATPGVTRVENELHVTR